MASACAARIVVPCKCGSSSAPLPKKRVGHFSCRRGTARDKVGRVHVYRARDSKGGTCDAGNHAGEEEKKKRRANAGCVFFFVFLPFTVHRVSCGLFLRECVVSSAYILRWGFVYSSAMSLWVWSETRFMEVCPSQVQAKLVVWDLSIKLNICSRLPHSVFATIDRESICS